jgi:hypothetical protein
MATVHPSRTCLPKLCCSIAVAGLLITGILLTGAYPRNNLNHYNLNQTDAITNGTNITSSANRVPRSLKTTVAEAQNKAVQTILRAYIFRNTDTQATILHNFFNQISASKAQVSRSTRAIKATQALEAAITRFVQNQPKPEYQISEYATGNRRWRRAPSVHPVEITELLNYEVQKKHNQNKNLGNKVAKILKRNTDFSDKLAEKYQTPSEKLKKDPVVALVMRTISTYMLVKHSKNGKEESKPGNLSPWGNPFFNKQNNTTEYTHKTRWARSPTSKASAKEETTTEWFLQKLATSPFPIQTIHMLRTALNILTNTTPEN